MLGDYTTFTLSVEHLKLLHHMNVHWDGSVYDGAPCIDIKRPYGNSDVVGDIYEITTGRRWDYAAHDERGIAEADPELCDRLLALHRETETALQVVLATGEFVAGIYRRRNYVGDWEPVA